MKDFKNLVWGALMLAAEKLERQIPKTKIVGKSQRIEGLTLREVMQTYPNIPDAATIENNQDDTVTLEWNEPEPVTKADVLKFKQRRFPDIAWSFVYNSLTENGYKRIGFWSSELQQFDGIGIYERYMAGDADFFVKYYSFRFQKS